jgi:hypothetical protein
MEKHEKRPRSYGASAYPEDIRVLAQKNAAQGKRLNLLQDVVFKDVFSADDDDSRKALKRLISVCIHREVADVRVLNSEISPEFVTGKTVRFDVHLDFNDGETADLEMQMGPGDNDIPSRATFYAVRLFSGQAGKQTILPDLFPQQGTFPQQFPVSPPLPHGGRYGA